MPKQFRFSLLSIIPLFATAMLTACATASSIEPAKQLSPELEHSQTLEDLYHKLTLGHFRKVLIDDDFSSELFDEYFDRLDNNRLYFLKSDIDEFQAKRFELDNDIKALDLQFAYDVYNRFQLRSRERMNFLLAELDKGITKYDFTDDSVIETDRSKANWVATKKELDQLWRKRLKIAALNFKLTDKPLDEANEILIKRYKNQLNRLDQVNSTDVFQMYANAITALYGPHTQYFSPRRSENFDIDMRLSLEGIGAVLQTEYENTKITRLIAAGPAEKSGQLNPSDLIVGVGQDNDGEMVDVVGWRLDEVVNLIRGPKGSTVRLQVIPAGQETKGTKEVVLVRNTIKLEEQAAQKEILEIERDGKTRKMGLITLPTFYIDFDAARRGDPDYRSTTRDVEKLIQELVAEGAEGLVIDLRNNGGGSLVEAINLTGLFIPQGPVVQVKDPWGGIKVHADYDLKYYDIPLAVIVNRYSASASEIFAGAIQDYNRGIIVGSQTFGKGTVQVLMGLKAGQVKLTRAKFYRVNGSSTQQKGVIPDIELPSIFDAAKVGESHSDGALPWDSVKPLPRLTYPALTDALGDLEKSHDLRVAKAEDYSMVLEQIDYQRKRFEEKTLPLNEDKLRKLRDEEKKWQLDMQNRLRLSRNLSAIESFEDLENAEADNQDSKPEDDIFVRESSEILLDLIQLSRPMTPSLSLVN